MVAQNIPFVIFAASLFFFNLGFYIIQMVLPYYNNIVLGGKEGDIALYMSIYLLVSMLFANVYQWLAKKFSLKALYASGLVLMALVFPLLYFLGTYTGPVPKKTLTLLLVALAGIPQASLYVFMGPILGQAIDLDEERTGQRREAIFSGINGFQLKLSMSLSSVIMGSLFSQFGFSKERPEGILLTGPVCGLFGLIGFLIFLKYPEFRKENRRA